MWLGLLACSHRKVLGISPRPKFAAFSALVESGPKDPVGCSQWRFLLFLLFLFFFFPSGADSI